MKRSKVVADYLKLGSVHKAARSNHMSYHTARKEIIDSGMTVKNIGQKYFKPAKDEFEKDCWNMKWYELEKKYGVSWSVIKYWKRSYKLPLKTTIKEVEYVINKNGCWKCTSHKASKGYPRGRSGQLIVKRNWIAMNETPWPEGTVTRHLCANKWCVNPKHVVPGTQFENLLDDVLTNGGRKGKVNFDGMLTKGIEMKAIKLSSKGQVIRIADNKKFPIYGKVEYVLSGQFTNGRHLRASTGGVAPSLGINV